MIVRNVKYRYWSKILNHFVTPDSSILEGVLAGNDEEMVVMKYTGLKDKRGNEIYGGDIVAHNNLHNESEIEVIGNIYENPELLEDNNG